MSRRCADVFAQSGLNTRTLIIALSAIDSNNASSFKFYIRTWDLEPLPGRQFLLSFTSGSNTCVVPLRKPSYTAIRHCFMSMLFSPSSVKFTLSGPIHLKASWKPLFDLKESPKLTIDALDQQAYSGRCNNHHHLLLLLPPISF